MKKKQQRCCRHHRVVRRAAAVAGDGAGGAQRRPATVPDLLHPRLGLLLRHRHPRPQTHRHAQVACSRWRGAVRARRRLVPKPHGPASRLGRRRELAPRNTAGWLRSGQRFWSWDGRGGGAVVVWGGLL